MAEVKILPEPRRSCEECRAIRAATNPLDLRRKLPPRAVAPTVGPSPATVLRELMAYPLPEPVWERIAQTALDKNDPELIAEAIAKLDWHIAQHKKGQAKLQKHLPNLYPTAA
jgi:hypothetical protein